RGGLAVRERVKFMLAGASLFRRRDEPKRAHKGPAKKMRNLWHACRRRLEQELPAQQFNTWIKPLAPEAAAEDSSTLVLAVPNRFILETVRERFLARISALAAESGGRDIELKLVLARAPEAPARGAVLPLQRPGQVPVTPDRARLNRNFTFDTFVTG